MKNKMYSLWILTSTCVGLFLILKAMRIDNFWDSTWIGILGLLLQIPIHQELKKSNNT